jgi:hypothetical protein
MSIKLPELTCSSKAAKLKRPSAAHFTELDAMPYKGRTEIAESHAVCPLVEADKRLAVFGGEDSGSLALYSRSLLYL